MSDTDINVELFVKKIYFVFTIIVIRNCNTFYF